MENTKNTPYQAAYREFMDLFCGFTICDDIKKKDVMKSELFSFLYRETWEEQCKEKEMLPIQSDEYVEENIDYDLLKRKISAAFNNHYNRYIVSEKKPQARTNKRKNKEIF